MKKTHHFTALSDKVCIEPGCNKRLKKNVVERHPAANRCFKHYMEHYRKFQNMDAKQKKELKDAKAKP